VKTKNPRLRAGGAVMSDGAVALVAATFLLVACAGPPTRDASRRTFEYVKKDWPLSVDSGTFVCEGTRGAALLTFKTERGKTYAVNGLAKAAGQHPPIDDIWAEATAAERELTGATRRPIGDFIDWGLLACDE
jgi:hypothetical protein